MTEIVHFTPKIRMQYRHIQVLLLKIYKELAEQYEIDPDALFREITDFAMLSLRVKLNGKNRLDFKLLSVGDTPEQIKKKFEAYLNTSTAREWFEIERAVEEFDAPVDEALAPTLNSDDPNSEGGG